MLTSGNGWMIQYFQQCFPTLEHWTTCLHFFIIKPISLKHNTRHIYCLLSERTPCARLAGQRFDALQPSNPTQRPKSTRHPPPSFRTPGPSAQRRSAGARGYAVVAVVVVAAMWSTAQLLFEPRYTGEHSNPPADFDCQQRGLLGRRLFWRLLFFPLHIQHLPCCAWGLLLLAKGLGSVCTVCVSSG